MPVLASLRCSAFVALVLPPCWFSSCRLLNEATGSLLDDVQLVNTLQTSKVTATKVTQQLETSEQTEAMIDSAREVRRSPLLRLLLV